MNLVIVESPTKAKTIQKFLGKDYKVESSFGHIMDLPQKELGVDVNDNYEPTYVIPLKAINVEEYWSVEALLKTAAGEELTAGLIGIGEKTLGKLDIKNKEQAEEIKQDLAKAAFSVTDVNKKQTTKNPLPPFTTATLQQTANARLGFSAKQTMMLAQQLYEHGFITYMRTDSVNLSEQFVSAARGYITDNFGAKYLPAKTRAYKSKTKNAQEAHEAIRPTDVAKLAESLPANFWFLICK